MGTGLLIQGPITYNIQSGGLGGLLAGRSLEAVTITGWTPPLPAAAGHGVAHCDPSVLHVVVVAVDTWEPVDRGDSSL